MQRKKEEGQALLPLSVCGKAAHRPLKDTLCPLPRQPAQERDPRGTRSSPLSAARFPA